MKVLALAVCLLILLTPFDGTCRGQQTHREGQSPTDQVVTVSDQEVESHRIGSRPILRANMDDREAPMLVMQGISVEVTVGLDGAVTGAAADVNSRAPANLRRQAEAAVRHLAYHPFERDGRVVAAKFTESVGVLPPELQPEVHIPFPTVRDWKSVRITLARMGCFGTCPVYKVEVHGDGAVLYEGRRFVAIIGRHRASVSRKTVEELVNKFRQADYYSLLDSYWWDATDLPMYETSIEIDGKSQKLDDYAGEKVGMPMAVSELEGAIDELADTKRWTQGNGATVGALKAEAWNFHAAEAADTLARVAEYGNADAVLGLIAAGVPVNGRDEMQSTPLQRATWRGDVVMLRALREADHGASLASRDGNGRTMLMAAAASGVPAVVEEILQHRPEVNAHDSKGRTALMEAVGRWGEGPPVNRAEVVALLLRAGADPNAMDDDGNTALIDCGSDADAALALIQGGASVNARSKKGYTPLINAPEPDVVRVLLENGADLSARDQDGKTALDMARQYGLKEKAALLEAAQVGKRVDK